MRLRKTPFTFVLFLLLASLCVPGARVLAQPEVPNAPPSIFLPMVGNEAQATGQAPAEEQATPEPLLPEEEAQEGSTPTAGAPNDVEQAPGVLFYDPATGQETFIPPQETVLATVESPNASTLLEQRQAAEQARRQTWVEEGLVNAVPGDVSEATLPALQDGEVTAAAYGSLKPVSSPHLYPWRAVVKVRSTFQTNTGSLVWPCTGILIRANWVLTRGTCVKHPTYGWASQTVIEPTPGDEPIGPATVNLQVVLTDGSTAYNSAYDMGWMRLNRPVGVLTDYVLTDYRTDNTFYGLQETPFESPGYPSGTLISNPGGALYNASGTFLYATETGIYRLGYSNYGSYQGSPAITRVDGFWGTHGVLSHREIGILDAVYTRYTRMTKTRMELIDQNMDENAPTQADFIPMGTKLGAGSIMAGSSLSSHSFIVYNHTSAPSSNGPTKYRLYLSLDRTITASDRLLGNFTLSARVLVDRAIWTYTSSGPSIPADVPAGTYYVGVILDVSDANTANNTVSSYDVATLVVTSPPPTVLKTVPPRINIPGTVDGPNPCETVIDTVAFYIPLSVQFDGVLKPEWTASIEGPNSSWLRIQSRTQLPGTGTVLLNCSTTGLGPGIYDATAVIRASKATPQQVSVPVQLRLSHSTMAASPRTFAFNALQGATAPVTSTATLSFTTGARPPWIAVPQADWLRVSPAQGTGGGPVQIIADPTGLGQGDYSSFVEVRHLSGTGVVATERITISLTVGFGSGALLIEPGQLSFVAMAGDANPSPQTLAVTGGSRGWVAVPTAPWLQLGQSLGTIPGSISVAPNIGGLPPGVHTGQIVVSSGETLSRSIPVVLTIGAVVGGQEAPLLQIAPAQVSLTAVVGGAPAPQSIRVENLGAGALNWTASSSTAWLGVEQTSGTAPGEVRIVANPAGLAPGNHVGEVTVDAPGAQGSPQVVTVLLTVARPPTLAIDGSQLIFSGIVGEGELPAQEFVVRNSGPGQLAWNASEEIGWLALETRQGATPSAVRVRVNPAGLAPGVHTGAISVQAEGAAASPRTVQVMLYLARGPVLGVARQTFHLDMIAGERKVFTEFDVRNLSQGTLNWTATAGSAWLSLARLDGTVAPYSLQPVELTVDAARLAPREAPYVEQFVVNTSNGEGGPRTVTVNVMVQSKARYCRIPNGGADYVINTSQVKIWMENVKVTPKAAGCDLTARVRASLPQNANLMFDIAGTVDDQNKLKASANATLDLGIGEVKLKLTRGVIISDEEGLVVPGGSWEFSARFGNQAVAFPETLRFGANGVTVDGKRRFSLGNLKWGSFVLTNNTGAVTMSSDGQYLFEMDGTLNIDVDGSKTTAQIKLVLDKRGIRKSSVPAFTIRGIAGLDLDILDGSIVDNRINAKTVRLRMPAEWGGGESSIYNVSIFNDGTLTVGSGRFKLPDLALGSDEFSLTSLEGEFASRGGGRYFIRALGAFSIKDVEDVGDCRMWVDVTFESGPSNQVRLTVSPPTLTDLVTVSGGSLQNAQQMLEAGLIEPDSLDALRLQRLVVGARCRPGWAIGTTSMFVTGIEGTIELEYTATGAPRLDVVQLKAWIESGARIKDVPIMSLIPLVRIRPAPFSLDYEAATYYLRFKAKQTKGHISRRLYSSESFYDYISGQATIGMTAGKDANNAFFVRGTGQAALAIPKGKLLHECVTYWAPTWKDPERQLQSCLDIPDSDIKLARAEAAIDLRGIDISIRISRLRGNARLDFGSGDVTFSGGVSAATVTSADVLAAQRRWEAAHKGEASAAAIDDRFAFPGLDEVLYSVPIAPSVPVIQAAGVITPIQAPVQSDAVFGLVQPPDGPLVIHLIAPNGVEYHPGNLPPEIAFDRAVSVDGAQSVYFVAAAMPGVWKVKVVGDTQNNGFFITHALNTPPPALSRVAVTPIGGQSHGLKLQWELFAAEAPTRINVYATTEPVSQTVTYTDEAGAPATAVEFRYVGEPILSGVASPTGGELNTADLSLSHLPSGDYALWIEAIGADGRSARCYIRAGSADCNGAAPVYSMAVNHAATFPTTWTPDIQVVTRIKAGELELNWPPLTHPDVGGYKVHIETTDPFDSSRARTLTLGTGAAVPDGIVRLTAGNIEPGQLYTVTIEAVDDSGTRSVRTGSLLVTTPEPKFQIDKPAVPVVVAPGSSTAVPLLVQLGSELPYPVVVDVDWDNLEDGLYVTLLENRVSAALTQGQIGLRIDASATIMPGRYVVPLEASSGRFRLQVNIPVNVVASGGTVYLPVVRR